MIFFMWLSPHFSLHEVSRPTFGSWIHSELPHLSLWEYERWSSSSSPSGVRISWWGSECSWWWGTFTIKSDFHEGSYAWYVGRCTLWGEDHHETDWRPQLSTVTLTPSILLSQKEPVEGIKGEYKWENNKAYQWVVVSSFRIMMMMCRMILLKDRIEGEIHSQLDNYF